MRALLVVFTEPASEEVEAVYNEWYTKQHLPDCLAVPGYVRATRYKAFEGDRAIDQRYLAMYELDVPDLDALRFASDEHMRRIREREMVLPPRGTLDDDSMRAMYYVALGPRLGAADAVPESVFLPFTDPASKEQEEEFRAWYLNVHLPEVLMVPGFEAATLYEKTDVNMLGREWVVSHDYMAFYELPSARKEDFESTMTELQRRISAGDRMEISPSLGSRFTAQGYRHISPRIDALDRV
jgi:hypothetical protein